MIKTTLNSAIITLFATLIAVIFSIFGSYVIGYLKLKYSSWVRPFLLSLQMLPAASSLVPLYFLLKYLHLLNSQLGLVVVYMAFALPTTTLLLTGYFSRISKELGESAKLDGCNIFQILMWIVFPIVIPGITSVMILNFITIWQEFLFAVTFISDPDYYTLPVGLTTYIGVHGTDWGGLMATSVIITIPAVFIFLTVQHHFVDSLSGAVKG